MIYELSTTITSSTFLEAEIMMCYLSIRSQWSCGENLPSCFAFWWSMKSKPLVETMWVMKAPAPAALKQL